MVAPGTKEVREGQEEEEALDSEWATRYRAMVARMNYLTQDRSDLCFTVKELAREMSSPTMASWKALKKLARYILGAPRVVTCYPYQTFDGNINIHSDTDWAGCARTRRSTTGTIVLLGSHLIKGSSTTQSVVALSSGEAEFYGLVRAGTMGIGIRGILKEMGLDAKIRICTDASAALGIANRRGVGKVRHIETSQLWLQEHVARGDLEIEKVNTQENLADALTKYVSSDAMRAHMKGTLQELRAGRHELMPEVVRA